MNETTQQITPADRAIAEYLEQLDSGQPVDREAFLVAHPEAEAELRRFFENSDVLEAAVAALDFTVAADPTADYCLPRSACSRELPAPSDAQPVLVPGYQIVAPLGQGGMGVVYKAVQLSLNRPVAIKLLPPHLASDRDRLRRLHTEAALAARVHAAHVLPVFDIVPLEQGAGIVLPYVEGCDLARLVHDRLAVRAGRDHPERHPVARLSDEAYLAQVLPLLDKLVEAVWHLHRAHVLHCDIKPSNVLVDAEGEVWLSDFGLARLLAPDDGEGLIGPCGTPGYASPEQGEGLGDLDERSDQFGLAATIYAVLALRLPYGAAPVSRQAEPVSDLAESVPTLPAELAAVVHRALHPDRECRYRNTAEFRSAWRTARGLDKRAPELSPAQRRLHRGGWAAAAIGLAAAIMWGLHSGDRQVARNVTVRVATRPAGAIGVLVPLDPDTGEPLPAAAHRDPVVRGKFLEFPSVPPGEYWLEVAVPGHGFHEVYRVVPQFDEKPGTYRHNRWMRHGKNTVELQPVDVPPASVVRGMARLAGSQSFRMGTYELGWSASPHDRKVEPFYIDTTEVSVDQFNTAMEVEWVAMPERGNGNRATRNVSWHDAVECAERLGKRLPWEAEYEFAATKGGTRHFPWGNVPRDPADWPLGAVGTPAYDRLNTNPPVFGLYSNVAEWTMSGPGPYPGTDLRYSHYFTIEFPLYRVVRGGHPSQVEQRPRGDPPANTPRLRISYLRVDRQPGLGFRCARSARPRFLNIPWP
jgi:formylglycine-generating enzyme required for sulfatase activity